MVKQIIILFIEFGIVNNSQENSPFIIVALLPSGNIGSFIVSFIKVA